MVVQQTGAKPVSIIAHWMGNQPLMDVLRDLYQSGEVDKAGRVSKCGDGMVRGLLFEAAKVLLSRSAKPGDLQSWGRALTKRIGRKKATMAVARKLAVVLHRMWTTGERFRWTATSVPTTA